jgi:hypothetical protein
VPPPAAVHQTVAAAPPVPAAPPPVPVGPPPATTPAPALTTGLVGSAYPTEPLGLAPLGL